MKVKLLGIQELDFETQNGKVEGIKLHLSMTADNVEGLAVDTLFIPAVKYGIVKIKLGDFIGKDIDVQTNFKGKAVSISA